MSSGLKEHSCVAMKNFFLQAQAAESQQSQNSQAQSQVAQTGPLKKKQSHKHLAEPPGTHHHAKPSRTEQEDPQESSETTLLTRTLSELTWCCCAVELLSILNSKTGTETDPRCYRPPSSQSVRLTRSRLLQKREGCGR